MSEDPEGEYWSFHCCSFTLLVQGWACLCLQSFLILHDKDSIKSGKHSSQILIHIDMISSQISLRSGVREGCLTTLNSLLCSGNALKMILTLSCDILLESAIRRRVQCDHKGVNMVSYNSQVGCVI